jgi:hypothetical protein
VKLLIARLARWLPPRRLTLPLGQPPKLTPPAELEAARQRERQLAARLKALEDQR